MSFWYSINKEILKLQTNKIRSSIKDIFKNNVQLPKSFSLQPTMESKKNIVLNDLTLEELESNLRRLIEEEKFEKACLYRDEIKRRKE